MTPGRPVPTSSGELGRTRAPSPALTCENVLPGDPAGRGGQDPSPPPRSMERGGGSRTCQPGARLGPRILPGRHQDSCEDDGCLGCELCPAAHCQTCNRAHAEVTCPSCLSLARSNLAEVVALVRELPAQAVNGRQAYRTHHGIPGGDALVMLAPAAPHRTPGSTRPVYAEPGDPRPPLDVLAYWAAVWRARERMEVPHPPTMARVTGLLAGELHRIAATPLFPQLAKDLGRVLHSVQNVLHAGHRPDVSRVPCLSCGTRLVKVWTDDPARDHHRCPVCGEAYDAGRYERAKHDQLHSRGADRFVPVSDALAVTGRPEQTVRRWMRDGLVSVRRDRAGRLLVWWPDVRDRHRSTPTRKRGRPA